MHTDCNKALAAKTSHSTSYNAHGNSNTSAFIIIQFGGVKQVYKHRYFKKIIRSVRKNCTNTNVPSYDKSELFEA